MCSVSRSIALLEDKELTTDLTHDSLLSQKHLTVVCIIDLHSNIDQTQVYSGPFAPTWTHPWITDLTKFELVCSRCSGATCLFPVTASA